MNRDELKKTLLDDFGHLDDKQLMSLAVYGEARGEGRKGQIAVGSVILERVDHRAWDGKTIKEVCLMPYQFSCFLPSDPNYLDLKITARHFDARYEKSACLQNCYAVASGLIDGTIPRTPEIAASHCCQYATVKGAENVSWDDTMKLVATIGHHQFYA